MNTLPETWHDLYLEDSPINFDAFLKSHLLERQRNFFKIRSIIYFVAGPISFFASSAIIYHILKSHVGLSTTYHRLIICLSVSDMISSFAYALSSIMTPREMHYFIPYARGNVATCTAQGFLLATGTWIASIYNCFLCFNYLAIIVYNKNNAYIKKRLEPWFHAVPLILLFLFGTIYIQNSVFNNSDGGTCFFETNYPPHCIGYDNGSTPDGFTVPCGRGNLGNFSFGKIVLIFGIAIPTSITPTVIVGTMAIMYRAISKIEKKMASYGVRSLPTVRERAAEDNHHRGMMRIICIISRCNRNHSCFRSKRKRAILNMALGYSLAWLFIWVPYILSIAIPSETTKIIVTIFHPLQGVYNFCVYLSPKVRGFKNPRRMGNGIERTWYQAFSKAWMFRGTEQDLERKRIRSTASGRSSLASLRHRISQFSSRLKVFGFRISSGLKSRSCPDFVVEAPPSLRTNTASSPVFTRCSAPLLHSAENVRVAAKGDDLERGIKGKRVAINIQEDEGFQVPERNNIFEEDIDERDDERDERRIPAASDDEKEDQDGACLCRDGLSTNESEKKQGFEEEEGFEKNCQASFDENDLGMNNGESKMMQNYKTSDNEEE